MQTSNGFLESSYFCQTGSFRLVKVCLVQLILLCSLVFSVSVFAQAEDDTVIPANTAGSESVTISTMEQDQAKSQTMTTGSLTGNGGGIPPSP